MSDWNVFFKMAKKGQNYSYSSLQIDAPKSFANKIIDYGQSIPKKDLGEDGAEDEIHITVKYGFHTESPEEFKEILKDVKPFKVKIGEMSIFKADEGRDSDVVKLDIHSLELHKLNKLVSKVKNTSKYKEYIPHLTIAYVKKGLGEKYKKKNMFKGEEFEVTELTFSSSNGKKTVIKLGDK
jgi:2'-5' RNA ligase